MVNEAPAQSRAASVFQESKVQTRTVVWTFVALSAIAASIVWVVWILSWARYGLDVTDEASYINAIVNPGLYDLSITQHGFFYHYLFYPFVDDIGMLRILNITVTLALGVLFGVTLFGGAVAGPQRLGWPQAVAASIPFSFTTLLFATNWLVTPSYNALDLQGLLIAATALLLIASPSSRVSYAGCVILAVGGWITFLAKPSSALLLAVVALAYLAATRRLTLSRVILAVAVCALLLVLTAIVIDGSVAGFVTRNIRALALPAALDQRYGVLNLFRLDLPPLWGRDVLLLLASSLGVAAVLSLCESARPVPFMLGVAALAGIAALPLLAFAGILMPSAWADRYQLQILAVPLGIGLFVLPRLRQWRQVQPALARVALVLLLGALPYVFAFGTNNNYWTQSAMAGIFWVAAGVALLRALQKPGTSQPAIFPIVIPSFAISMTVLLIGMEHPYRQTQPIRLNDQAVTLGKRDAELILSADFAAYFRQLAKIAAAGGFRPATPMVDLTGHYPGALFALGAEVIAQPWIVGGYPGSERLAALALSRVPCATLAESWLLTEPGGRRAISQTVLGDFGMRFQDVGSVDSLTGSYPTVHRQHLLRPVHDTAAVAAACERKRRAQDQLTDET